MQTEELGRVCLRWLILHLEGMVLTGYPGSSQANRIIMT